MLQEKFRSYVRERSLCTARRADSAGRQRRGRLDGDALSFRALRLPRRRGSLQFSAPRQGGRRGRCARRTAGGPLRSTLFRGSLRYAGRGRGDRRFGRNGRPSAPLRLVRQAVRRARVRQDRHRSPCRRLGRDLFHQPDSRDRAARADRHPCGQRPADPSAAFLDAPRDRRLCPGQQDSLSGGLVERFDQIPAQQVPGSASFRGSRKYPLSSPKR